MPRVISLTLLALLTLALGAGAQGAPTDCAAGLDASPQLNGTILLEWAPVPNATAYQVGWRGDGGNWTLVTPQVPPAATSYSFPAELGVVYEFAVVATGVDAVPYCHAFAVLSPADAPACPEGLRATDNGNHTITLSWNAVLGADGYNVFGPSLDTEEDFLGHTTATHATVDADVPYEPKAYRVNATAGELQSHACDPLVVASAEVPFFPSTAAVVLGAGGAALGTALVLGRRR